jgi:Amt family ammonium transporter
MTLDTTHQLAETIPESVFCLYELAFAITTTSLLLGSLADRMKYAPLFIAIPLWLLVVYCPIAHSNWHPDGWLFKV